MHPENIILSQTEKDKYIVLIYEIYKIMQMNIYIYMRPRLIVIENKLMVTKGKGIN